MFVDAGGFFAHLVSEDAHRLAAAALFARAWEEHWQLVTTSAVVLETYSLMLVRARHPRETALRFLSLVERGLCRVEHVSADDQERAIALVRAHEDKNDSLFD
ncbi:MAG: hypothetical protein HY814_06365 [Candidatus Riflebacteria bacterium]|nr:hypothetical protein [Candidatus Riflebacteria bacterium]